MTHSDHRLTDAAGCCYACRLDGVLAELSASGVQLAHARSGLRAAIAQCEADGELDRDALLSMLRLVLRAAEGRPLLELRVLQDGVAVPQIGYQSLAQPAAGLELRPGDEEIRG